MQRARVPGAAAPAQGAERGALSSGSASSAQPQPHHDRSRILPSWLSAESRVDDQGTAIVTGGPVGGFVGLGLRDGTNDGVGVGFGVGVGVGLGGASGVGDGVGDGVTFGATNRALLLSRFIAVVAAAMNCRQIGPAKLDPKTSVPPDLVSSGPPSLVPTQTAAANARV
jgi:hypothetical protein